MLPALLNLPMKSRHVIPEWGNDQLECRDSKLKRGDSRLERGDSKLEWGDSKLECGDSKLEWGDSELERGDSKLASRHSVRFFPLAALPLQRVNQLVFSLLYFLTRFRPCEARAITTKPFSHAKIF
jgi:hypothetical protein